VALESPYLVKSLLDHILKIKGYDNMNILKIAASIAVLSFGLASTIA